jgi:hypothetical protein
MVSGRAGYSFRSISPAIHGGLESISRAALSLLRALNTTLREYPARPQAQSEYSLAFAL